MVLFLGEITNSQVAINNGTVTQTMMKEPPESHRASTVEAPIQQETTSPDMGGKQNEPLISAEECQNQLLQALDGLVGQLDERRLSADARQATRHLITKLQSELNRSPINIVRVRELIEQIRVLLAGTPKESEKFPAGSGA
ncbi:hypothetical protein [Streptomyces sp. NPDC058614]|uniref:hypothetical protein n=1 Tax=Streptomyces sp. NPDC058614 TaxID=3346557 RepID=UPI00365BE1C1